MMSWLNWEKTLPTSITSFVFWFSPQGATESHFWLPFSLFGYSKTCCFCTKIGFDHMKKVWDLYTSTSHWGGSIHSWSEMKLSSLLRHVAHKWTWTAEQAAVVSTQCLNVRLDFPLWTGSGGSGGSAVQAALSSPCSQGAFFSLSKRLLLVFGSSLHFLSSPVLPSSTLSAKSVSTPDPEWIKALPAGFRAGRAISIPLAYR